MKPLFELKITTAAPGSRDVAGHLFRQLKEAIRDQRLPPGSRMPATRDAKRLFGVSRNTAQDVYDRLAQEGLLRARHGSGSYVRETEPQRPAPTAASPMQPVSSNPFWERADTTSWMAFWHETSGKAPPAIADLRPALVDQSLFPHSTFRQVMARELRRLETHPASSRSPQRNPGNYHLRRAIAEHIGLTRAVACQAQDVLVTAGAQQAFDLIARTMVIPGKTVVAVEDPGYPPMRVPFAAAGALVVPVRVDGEGIIVDEIPSEARIICVCPSHQFPLGMQMSERRREALLEFARRNGAVIVEDDYDGEFRYEGNPLDALKSDASSSHVFYVGSFSKCMFPAMRLGFVVPPAWIFTMMVTAKNATDWHCSVPIQAAVASFTRSGHLARHIRRVRRIYQHRRDHLLNLLDRKLRGRLRVIPSFYGMHLAAVASDAIDADQVSERLAAKGIMIHSLTRYGLGLERRNGFILGYAAADEDQLTLAVEALAQEMT